MGTSATTSYTISSTANLDDEYDLNPAKRWKSESCIDFVIDDLDCIQSEDINTVEKPCTRKTNLPKKKKAKFSTKNERMRKTAEGRKELLERDRLAKEKLRATPEGR